MTDYKEQRLKKFLKERKEFIIKVEKMSKLELVV